MRTLLKRAALSVTAIAAATAITLAVLWHNGVLQPWLQAKIVEWYARKIQPHIPFVIENVDVDASWREFLEGRIRKLAVVIRWNEARFRLSGPIEILEPSDYVVFYQPTATVETLKGARSSPVALKLSLQAPKNLKKLEAVALEAEAPEFKWAPLPGSMEDAAVSAQWGATRSALHVTARAKSAQWQKSDTDAANIQDLNLELDTPFAVNPFRLGPAVAYRATAKSAEVLQGEVYLDLPLQSFPATGEVRLGEKLIPAAASLASPQIRVDWKHTQGRHHFSWNLSGASIPGLVSGAVAATSSSGGPLAKLADLNRYQFYRGKVHSQGEAVLGESLDASLEIDHLDVGIASAKFLARDVSASFPKISTREGVSGTIEARELWLRKIRGSLGKTTVKIAADQTAEIGAGGQIPLQIEGAKIRLKEARGKLPDLLTALEADVPDAARLARDFCVSARIPPATATLHFPRVEITPGMIDPQGAARLTVFGGAIDVSEIGFFDLNTDVPEIYFSAMMDGIRLDQAGAWMNFGEMNGVLTGHARDVVMQGKFATQFDFHLELKNSPGERDIVFSPEAMRNVASVISGNDFHQIPGIAQWFVFGWPSRVFGGYDIDYAGITAISREGNILLETLEPPKEFSGKSADQNHYILYGTRFKIPLKSKSYPLVVDAPAFIGYVHIMAGMFKEISEGKKEKTDEPQAPDPDCDPAHRYRRVRDGERELPRERGSKGH